MFQHDQKNENWLESLDFESQQRVVQLFEILLKVDSRNHPENYKNQKQEND